MVDLSRLWNLPPPTLAPLFQLVANTDPFLEDTYDFIPQHFGPSKSVQWQLRELREDATRGYGTQTGFPDRKSLPPIHCRPIVSGESINSVIKMFDTENVEYGVEDENKEEKILFFNSWVGGGDEASSTGTETATEAETKTTKHKDQRKTVETGQPMNKEMYDQFLTTLSEGSAPEEMVQTNANGNKLFDMWSDLFPNIETGQDELCVTFLNFCLLIEEWGELRKREKQLHEGLSGKFALLQLLFSPRQNVERVM